MVSLRFKSEKARYKAWQKAGGNKKVANMGALKNASWSGKSVHFPSVRTGSKKHRELIKILKN